MKNFVILILIAVGVFVLYDRGLISFDKKELLSSHKTRAVFRGLSEYSGQERASFQVVDYLDYQKSSPSGEGKRGNVDIVTKRGDELEVRAQLYRAIVYLEPGDSVLLNYDQYQILPKEKAPYVKRVLMKIQKI